MTGGPVRPEKSPPPEGGGLFLSEAPWRLAEPGAAPPRPYRWTALPPLDAGGIAREKLRLAREAGRADSVRDYGGIHLVRGRYLLETAAALGARRAQMIDGTRSAEFEAAAAEAARRAGIEVGYLQADFREKETFAALEPAEVSLLYEVLLHQENAVEVLRNVAAKTLSAICVAQPCLREDLFPLPAAAVNLQFYPEPLKSLLREGSFWPLEPAPRLFDTTRWLWGQTTSYLLAALWGLGWAAEETSVSPETCGRWWEYSFLRFRKRN